MVLNNEEIFRKKYRHGSRSILTFRAALGVSGIFVFNYCSILIIIGEIMNSDIGPYFFSSILILPITTYFTTTQKHFKRLMLRNLREYYFNNKKELARKLYTYIICSILLWLMLVFTYKKH